MRRLPILLALALVPLFPLGTAGTADAAACTNPRFVTSDPNGMWSSGRYIVHNNMWNVSGYNVREKLSACSHRSWKVTATADNASGDGAVKTYPNVHRDFHDWSTGWEPRLSSFSKIRSRWAATTPRVGIYNAAYDIWLNGVPGKHEVMIWTDNYRQVPSGSPIAVRKFGGIRWKVWATRDNSYIAFVPKRPLTHGKLKIKKMLNWLIRRHRLAPDVTLGQICFGFEVVSTNGKPATFTVDNFSVSTKRR